MFHSIPTVIQGTPRIFWSWYLSCLLTHTWPTSDFRSSCGRVFSAGYSFPEETRTPNLSYSSLPPNFLCPETILSQWGRRVWGNVSNSTQQKDHSGYSLLLTWEFLTGLFPVNRNSNQPNKHFSDFCIFKLPPFFFIKTFKILFLFLVPCMYMQTISICRCP